MKFIKALQKTEAERPPESMRDEIRFPAASLREKDDSDDFVTRSDLRIGAPGSQRDEGDRYSADSSNIRLPADEIDGLTFNSSDQNAVGWSVEREFLVDAARVNPHLISITQPSSSFAEEYRSLRTQIIQSSQHRLPRSIVIASVAPGEGKSVTALNLSWLMAQTDGIRALLIDGDLRMPSSANYLGFETDIGLSHVLSGEASFRESIIRLQPAGLCLLPGGRRGPDAAELISGPRLGEILAEAGELFDYVIIDAPPLGAFTDAAVLINNADAALLVVRADHTRYKEIERQLESLPTGKMLGVVLNQSSEVLLSSNYYDYAYPKAYIS